MADKLEDAPYCDCCGFLNPVSGVVEVAKPSRSDGNWKLCELCSRTQISNIAEAADRRMDVSLAKSIAYIGNRIRRDIADSDRKPPARNGLA
jgi:hypothetical protein